MKAIPEHYGYFATKDGKIYSNKSGSLKELAIETGKKGYLRVCFTEKGKSKKYLVHRLIALTFIPQVKNKKYINHINGIKSDNRVENLEWCTASENLKDVFKRGARSQKGEGHNNSILTNEIVLGIREMAASGKYNQRDIANKYNIDIKLVSLIVLRKRWKHI